MDSLDVFEVLVRENVSMLNAFVRSSVTDSAAIDDICQETMVTAWKRWNDYDRNRPFGAWLRGIARNHILAYCRNKPLPSGVADMEDLCVVFDRIQSLQGDTFDDKLDALRTCVKNLPEKHREVIRLRSEERLMPARIATTQSIKLETVKKHLYRAKQLLHDCIHRKLGLHPEGRVT